MPKVGSEKQKERTKPIQKKRGVNGKEYSTNKKGY